MAADETKISEAEWDVLQALWARERGTARDLADDLEASRGWARTTVQTMLDRMAAKGLVSVRRVGNVKEFEPAVKPAEAQRSAWRRFVNQAFDGAVGSALAFIADDAKLTTKQRESLRRLLEEGRDD